MREGLVVGSGSDLEGHHVVGYAPKKTWRVSHAEEECPCRRRGPGGGGKGAVVVVTRRQCPGGGVVVVPEVVESNDKACVMNECGKVRLGNSNVDSSNDNSNNKRGQGKKYGLTTSLSLDRKKQKVKRYSVTSTSSSVSMLSAMRDQDEEEDAGDLNNNNNNSFKKINGKSIGDVNDEDTEEEKSICQQNRRNEEKEVVVGNRDSFGSASSFTKDIMRMIENNNNASHKGDADYYGSVAGDSEDEKHCQADTVNEDEEKTKGRRSSEVILKMMNRRNSDMSDGKVKVLEKSTPTIICDCACHHVADRDREKSKMAAKKLKMQKSPTSPQSVNIYSIEEPLDEGEVKKRRWGHEVGLEKGQMDGRESDDEEEPRREEYDLDEMVYYAEDDEVENKRRSVL